MANVELDVMRDQMRASRFFLHSTRNEPFGVSTVQAIGMGCVPVVHDSGGQREVVLADQLRYRDVTEAVEKLRNLSSSSIDLESLGRRLEQENQRFAERRFDAQMRAIIEKKLSSN
jgi:glycosyltransferase involved in cell wall biosynthesis